MKCSIVAIDSFSRDAKRLTKKYASLKNELKKLEEHLLENPRIGTLIRENTYKIRLGVKSKGKGKSGGMRIITYLIEIEIVVAEALKEQDFIVVLVAIYDKSEMGNISEKQLLRLINEIEEELNIEDDEQ